MAFRLPLYPSKREIRGLGWGPRIRYLVSFNYPTASLGWEVIQNQIMLQVKRPLAACIYTYMYKIEELGVREIKYTLRKL